MALPSRVTPPGARGYARARACKIIFMHANAAGNVIECNNRRSRQLMTADHGLRRGGCRGKNRGLVRCFEFERTVRSRQEDPGL